MSGKIHDFGYTYLPDEDSWDLRHASRDGYINLGKIPQVINMGNMSIETGFMVDYNVSSYIYFEEINKDPKKGSKEWHRWMTDRGFDTDDLRKAGIALSPVPPLGTAVTLFADGVDLAKNKACSIIINNRLNGDLKIAGAPYINCGEQTGRSSEVIVDEVTNVPITIEKDIIPGPKDYGDGLLSFATGMYRFEKDLSWGIGFYGTAGAIAFTTTDPDFAGRTFAIAWLVPERGKKAFYMTTNLFRYYDSLKDFYKKTADERKTKTRVYYTNKKTGKRKAAMYGSMQSLNFPHEFDEENIVLTVTVESRLM